MAQSVRLGDTVVNVDSVRAGAPLRLLYRGVEVEFRRVSEDDRAWSVLALFQDYQLKWKIPIVTFWSEVYRSWIMLDSTRFVPTPSS